MSASLAGRRPVVQLHPTRRCNLACAHCYTSSGPGERDELRVEVLERAVADAASLGYRQLAISGGEPFLYRSLPRLLAAGREAGLLTSVTTNGLVHMPEMLANVAANLDILAISVDGLPAEHNLMRCNPTAFERMQRRLAAVRASGVPFAFLFTLTQYNVDQLEWLAAFASQEGASLVQIHPLNRAGRAASLLRGAEPDAVELLAAVVEVERLRARHPGLSFQLDVATRGQLESFPGTFVAAADAALTELVPIVVIADTGEVVPISYDVDRSLRWGSILTERLPSMAERWRATSASRLADLTRRTYATLMESGEAAVHWYDTLATLSHASALVS